MKIDLHTHSTASDGTTSPAQLMKEGAAVGLNVIALTDHDTTAGWAEASAALAPGLTLVPGIELSCAWQRAGSEEPPISLHILGYLFDPTEPIFRAERLRVRQSRLARGERIVERLRADGVPITWDEVCAVANGAAVGRPHIGKVLINHGIVADMDAAFDSAWLGERYRVAKADVEVFTAIRLIRTAGGVAVFAHPKAKKRGKIVPDELIVELAQAGMAGLEVDHADHAEGDRARLRDLAAQLGLFVTGSSDYHGSHKKVKIGEYTTSVDAYERLAAAAAGTPPITRDSSATFREKYGSERL